MRELILAGLCVLFVAGTGSGEDLNPPLWRGSSGTTSQGWEFSTSDRQTTPDWGNFLTSTYVDVIAGEGMNWLDIETPSGRQGMWPLSGIMDVVVDNYPLTNPEKWIRVQITWAPMAGGNNPVPTFTNINPPPALQAPALVEERDLAYDWKHSTYEWKLDYNPPDEYFSIEGDIWVDELVVDTWCIPEPATMLLLAAGGLMLRRKKST